MAKTPKQRQQEYRARLKARGRTTVTCDVSSGAAKALREMAREHSRSMGEVMDLGILSAKAELGRRQRDAEPASTRKPGRHVLTVARSRTDREPPESPQETREPVVQAEAHAERATLPVAPERATEQGTGEPWWPDNHRQLLEGDGHE